MHVYMCIQEYFCLRVGPQLVKFRICSISLVVIVPGKGGSNFNIVYKLGKWTLQFVLHDLAQ